MDRIGAVGALLGIAADTDHLHAEGLAELGEMAADVARADDQHRLSADLILALGQIADHASPEFFVLVVARLRETTGNRQHQGHGMLGHGAGIDAAGAAQPHSPGAELLLGILVHAGTDRLDELEILGERDHVVLPHAGSHHDIGLADALLEVLVALDLETLDAGLAQLEAVLHAVGHVGKADRELVLRRKHLNIYLPGTSLPRLRGRCRSHTATEGAEATGPSPNLHSRRRPRHHEN